MHNAHRGLEVGLPACYLPKGFRRARSMTTCAEQKTLTPQEPGKPPRSARRLSVELPGAPALRWLRSLLRHAWVPFSLAIACRWLASALDVVGSSLLAYAVVQLGSTAQQGVPVPAWLVGVIQRSNAPLTTALLIALAAVVAGRGAETVVDWCHTWTHLKVNERLTPDVVSAALTPGAGRIVDPPTAVQRWLLKSDISYFIYDGMASSIGHLGTIVIILMATWRANSTAGGVAVAGVVVWAAVAWPMIARALHASRNAAEMHEDVGRIIRDSLALQSELARPSLKAFWRRRNDQPLAALSRAILQEGLWNTAMSGVLGLIARALPVVAVLAAASSGPAASMLVVLLYLTRLAAPLGGLANVLPWVQRNLVSLQRVFQLVGAGRDTHSGVPKAFHPQEIRVQNWVAALPDGEQIAFADFALRRGEFLCIIGPSGSGKSTMVESLSGSLPATGALWVDGEHVAAGDARWLETCQTVRQEPELVPGLLMDNLQGFPGWQETPALTRAVATLLATRLAGSDGEVGLDDKGVSVGQRRAISVLRALGSGAPVLLLDEPVAGIDDVLVRPIRDALVEARQAGTLILITAHKHDLARLRLEGPVTCINLALHEDQGSAPIGDEGTEDDAGLSAESTRLLGAA